MHAISTQDTKCRFQRVLHVFDLIRNIVTVPRSREVHVVAKSNILPGEETKVDYEKSILVPVI